ncbi:hypothetical protein [Chloroflexus sp.]|uniref:hypothetical protein n=1 Tax=Chloroflexus sp. TaxID=1904827 RepID=UPI00298ED9B0|nr:hypothetical protein [Chloroflexus sp.]MDW8403208.1 hypothetical protein [Chloroflexus sp.]
MGVTAGLICLLVVAAACFLLSQTGITRRLALLAALASGLAMVGVIIDPLEPAAATSLYSIGAIEVVLPAPVPLNERALVVALLFGGTIGLLALALTIPPATKGYGVLFGWLALALAAALLSLAIPPLSFLTPLSWALAVLAAHGALLVSGFMPEPGQLPPHLIAGAVAVVAVSGLIAIKAFISPNALPSTVPVMVALIGALALAGAPPFAGTRLSFANAPALVGALTAGLVLPAIGLGFITRAIPQLPPLPALDGQLLAAAGAIGALGAAISALRSSTGRELVLWQGALQAGVVVCAAAINDPLAGLAAQALLLALQLHAIAGGLVAAAIIQRQGNDQLDGSPARVALPLSGALWIFTTIIATGLPLGWSFWGWRWLIEALATRLVWAIAPLIAAALIGLAAGLPLLIRCWDGQTKAHDHWPEGMLGGLALAPLALAGLIPWLAWPLWLSWSPFAPPVLPAEPIAWPFIGFALTTGIGGWLLARRANQPQTSRDPRSTVIPTWYGMGDALRGLAEAANARTALIVLGRGIDRVASIFHDGMIIFEQRYYLFGVIVALLAILILMAQ